MGSYPRYICHFYDMMKNLAAYCNDTILVINRGLTLSEGKHGNFVIIGRGYSCILSSVDSK